MNAIASIQRPGRAAEGGQQGQAQSAALGGQLPDFAALLGMTMALGDLEQQLGGGAANAAASDAGSALACGPLAVNGEEPGAGGNESAENGATDGVMAMLQTQGAQAVLTGATAQETTGESGRGQAAQQNAALMMAKTANGQTKEAQGEETMRTWNVRELAHQIKAVFGQVASQGAQTGQGATTQAPATGAATFKGKHEGDKVRAGGMQNLLNAMAQGEGEDGAQAATQSLTGGPGAQGAGSQFFSAPDPRFKAQLAAAATAATAGAQDQAVEATEAEMTDAQAAPVAATPLAWSAKPGHGAEMPEMAEQVKQVADFLAERTEGVVKLGLNGVEANLKLYPPDLGGVRVQMTVGTDGTTQAQFIVERAETAQLLKQHLKSFQQGLESHGLTVDRVQVTVQGTARPGSAGSESGWRQDGTNQGFRRDETTTGERGGQNSRREGRERQQQGFGGNTAW